jgi:hypothetical protein
MEHLPKDFLSKTKEQQTKIVKLGMYSWSVVEQYVDEEKELDFSELHKMIREKGREEGKKQKEFEHEQQVNSLVSQLRMSEIEKDTVESRVKKEYEQEKTYLIKSTKLDLEKEFQTIKEENIRLKTRQEKEESLLTTCKLQAEQILELKQKIEGLEKTKSSATLGKEGEHFIERLLSNLPYEYEMTQDKAEKADIRISTKAGKHFILDSKKYKTNVGKKEKDKLARDVDNDATVCGGILVSIDTKITHQDHGDIIFTTNNKPILLITLMGMTLEAQIETLHISIKVLEQYSHLHEQKERADLVEKIKHAMVSVKESIQRFQNIEKNAKKILEDAKAGLDKLEPLQKVLMNN